MKLNQIFESTERGAVGGQHAPGSMSMDQAQAKLEEQADSRSIFFYDDVDTKDHYTIMALVEVGHIDSQKPTTNQLSRAETPEDFHGSFEVEWELTDYAYSDDEDGEFWTIHEASKDPVELTDRSNEMINDDIHEKVGSLEPEY